MHSRHSLCVGEVGPVLMSLIQRESCIHGTVCVLVRWILSSCPLFRDSTCIHDTVDVVVKHL